MAKRKTDITFTPRLVDKVGRISDVLAEFLEEQVDRIQKEVKGLPDQAVRHLLAQFVTEEGTKKPIARANIEGALAKGQLDAILNRLEGARILRQDTPNVYELAHDTLAERIADALDAEELEVRRAAKYVRDRLQAFEETHIYLTPKEVQLVEAHEGVLKERLSEKEWAYLINSRRFNKKQQRKRQAWIAGIIIGLSLLSAISIYYWKDAKTAYSRAEEQRRMAVEERGKAEENLRKAFNANAILEFEMNGDATKGFLFAKTALDSASNSDAEQGTQVESQQTLYSIVFQDPAPGVKWFYTTVARHEKAIKWAAFSPDGQKAITASADKNCFLFNLAGSSPPDTLGPHRGYVQWAAFSPDGKTIVTSSTTGEVMAWDSLGKNPRLLGKHANGVLRGAFSPQGNHLVTSDEHTAKIWTLDNPNSVNTLTGHTKTITWVGYSPDGKLILTASEDHSAILWNENGDKVATLTGHTAPINWAAFSPGGKSVITASDDRMAMIWNSANGELLLKLDQHASPVRWVGFSPDGGSVLTTSDDHTAILWKTNGQLLKKLEQHNDRVTFAAFSPDSKAILTASQDHTALLWDTNGGLRGKLLGHKDAVNWVGFSPDGKNLLTASADRTAKIWFTIEKAQARFHERTTPAQPAANGEDTSWILTTTSDNRAIVWDKNGHALRQLSGHSGAVKLALFSPGGQEILTASEDGTAVLWGRPSGKELQRFQGHKGSINSAVFSSDGDTIFTASEDWTIKLWDARSGAELSSLGQNEYGPFKSVQYVAHGKRVLALARKDRQGTVLLWKLENNKALLPTRLNDYQASVNSVQLLPGDIIATAAADHTVRLWNQDGTCLDTLLGHSGPVNGISLSPAGGFLSFSDDQTAIYWDTSRNIGTRLVGHDSPVVAATFSPDGERLLTFSKKGVARIWTTDGRLLASITNGKASFQSARFVSDAKDRLSVLAISADQTPVLMPIDRKAIAEKLDIHLDELSVEELEKWGLKAR